PGGGHGRHHLGAVLGDAARLVFTADHEAGDVLQEHQRDPALVAQLDEVRALECGLGEQDPVAGHDPDRVAVDAGEPGDQRGAVLRLELTQPRPVGDPGDHLAHVIRDPGVGRHHVVELVRVGVRLLGWAYLPGPWGARAQGADDVPDDAQRVRVVFGQVVGDPG